MMDRQELIGRWDLVSFERTKDGRVTGAPLGPKPSGFLLYGADGTMAAFLHRDPDLKREGPALAAYGGPWELKGGEVHHYVLFNTDADRAGKPLVRLARFDDGRLILETPPKDGGGLRITWTRHR